MMEDQAMKTSQAAAAGGLMDALRRSFSGPAKAAGILQGSRGKSTHMPASDAARVGPLAAGAGSAIAHNVTTQQLRSQMAAPAAADAGHPTPGDNVEMLDLDASRAYAMGVHHMLQGMATALCGSETSSKPPSPQFSEPDEGVSSGPAGAVAPMRTTGPQLAHSSEIEPAEEQLLAMGPATEEPSLGPVQEVQQQLQQLLQHSSQRQLAAPSTVLSPQASGRMHQQQEHRPLSATATGAAGAGSRSLRPSSSSTTGSRRQSQAAGASGPTAGHPATLGLPGLGQASMDILGRPSTSLMQPERRPLSSSSSLSMRLNDVYQQTAGNLNPLSAGLNTFKRSSR